VSDTGSGEPLVLFLLSNLNAFFCCCKMIIFIDYWWAIKKHFVFLFWKKCLKEAQIPKFCIFGRYILYIKFYLLSNFDLVVFFELIVMRAFSNLHQMVDFSFSLTVSGLILTKRGQKVYLFSSNFNIFFAKLSSFPTYLWLNNKNYLLHFGKGV
jgi:hypothetical protein